MPKVAYPYEVNGKLVIVNGCLIPICSLSNRSLLQSLTYFGIYIWVFILVHVVWDFSSMGYDDESTLFFHASFSIFGPLRRQ